ncbi:MAG: Phosphatidylinositol 3- and 4-kinase [Chloroflexi bacterium]|jgi:uncharacterized repeat protein (TIGR03843 family)|nr:MAG: Phosphatidylinositol 3- and 4-kinase [Chloroflexota bacterium]
MSSRELALPDALDLLEHSDLANPRLVPAGSNYTFLIDVCRDGQVECRAIYKPASGEAPLWDFPDGTLHKREYACYLLSSALGWDFVPPSVVRDGPFGPGAVLLYIDHDPRNHYFTMREQFEAEVKRICLFDVITNQADRKASHFLLGRLDERVWGIDHGLAFHEQMKLRTVVWDFAQEPIPQDLLEQCEALMLDLAAHREPAAIVKDWISPAEYQALQDRIEGVLEHPVFPYPLSRRSVPWPWL